MKELSKFQMAAVKRTAQSVKSLRTKKAKLEEKQAVFTKEIGELEDMIMAWEEPVIRMTGGFTSEQILNQEDKIELASTEEVQKTEVDDSKLDEFQIKNEDENLPFL